MILNKHNQKAAIKMVLKILDAIDLATRKS